MADSARNTFLDSLKARYGPVSRLPGSRSMMEVAEGAARVYLRYSKLHNGHRGFFGLRSADLRQMEGRPSAICFLWDEQEEPLIVPYVEYEDLFAGLTPASDGQYKVTVEPRPEGTVLYIANGGRFGVEGNYGWGMLDHLLGAAEIETMPELSHSQLQTLLGSIGAKKNYDIWIPANDRGNLDWSQVPPFGFRSHLPEAFEAVSRVIQEIDVIWLARGSNEVKALFEVEHSTPIYSGLLRFNDFHLVSPKSQPSFTIVADEARRSVFSQQVNRQTFRHSGLSEICAFLNYRDVLVWHRRLTS